MSEKTWFVDFLQALDGHTAASLAEAEEALSRCFSKANNFFMTDFPTLACHNRCKGN